jgi:DNA-binding beta-propeller fold protein YncE
LLAVASLRTKTVDGKSLSRRVVPVALLGLAVLVAMPLSTALGGVIYFTDLSNNKIQRTTLDGSTPVDVITNGDNPRSIALDPVGGKIYWTDTLSDGHSGIRRANLDGTLIEDVVTTIVMGIAVDPINSKVYWTNQGNRKIQRASLDGSNGENLVTPATADIISPWGIDLDLTGGKLYWVDGSIGKLQRANLDGSAVEELRVGLTAPLREIALDVPGSMLFIASDKSIVTTDLNGAGLSTLLTLDAGVPTGLAVDSLNHKLYWTVPAMESAPTAKIQRANLDGTGIETIYSLDGGGFSGIALDISAVPEPSTIALLGTGAAATAIGSFCRRRRVPCRPPIPI